MDEPSGFRFLGQNFRLMTPEDYLGLQGAPEGAFIARPTYGGFTMVYDPEDRAVTVVHESGTELTFAIPVVAVKINSKATPRIPESVEGMVFVVNNFTRDQRGGLVAHVRDYRFQTSMIWSLTADMYEIVS